MFHGFAKDERAGITIFLAALAFAVCTLHWYATPYAVFQHDLDAHQHYIRYVAELGRLPVPYEYWGYYHPPLYYALGALIYTIVPADYVWKAVSALSLVFYATYLLFSIRLLLELVKSYGAYVSSLAVLVFWPLGFNMARSINNDVPLFMAQTIMLYYLVTWWRGAGVMPLVKAVVWSAVSIAIKSSGLVSMALVFALMIAKFRKADISGLRAHKLLLLAALLIALLPLGRSYYYYRIAQGPRPPVFAMAGLSVSPEGNIPAEQNPYLDNALYHYFSFDLPTYIAEPFYDVWHDAGGRQYFWNSLLKTSLFDEFIWKDKTGARVLSCVQLLMVLLLFSYLLAAHRMIATNDIVLMAALAIYIVALVLLRVFFPASWHQEFRFIYAAIVPFCALYGRAVESLEIGNHRVAAACGRCFAAVFALQSLLIILVEDAG